MLDIFQKWKSKVVAQVETKVKIIQLEFIERTAKLLGTFIFILIFVLLGFGVFLFFGLGLAEQFSEWFNSYIGGYMAAGAVYLVVALIFYLLRKKILKKLSNVFISALTENDDEDVLTDQTEEHIS